MNTADYGSSHRRCRAKRLTPWPLLPLAAAAALSLAGTAWADSPAPPAGYAVVAGDHDQYLFVMLLGDCRSSGETLEFAPATGDLGAAIAAHPRLEEPRFRACRERTLRAAGDARLRDGVFRVELFQWEKRERQQDPRGAVDPRLDHYPYPGLYPNDGTLRASWIVDFEAPVEVSDDGRHLVRSGPWGGPLAVAFYDRGELVRAYDVAELVSDMDQLSYSVSHYLWIAEWNFSRRANRLRLLTLAGDRHVFDVATGELLQSEPYRPPRIGALLTLLEDNEQTTLAETRLCGNDYRLKRVAVRSFEAPYRLMATLAHLKRGEGAQAFRYFTVPLEAVVGLIQDTTRGEDEPQPAEGLWYRMQLRDGSTQRVALARGTALCGVDVEGDARQFSLAGLLQARLCGPADGVPCRAD